MGLSETGPLDGLRTPPDYASPSSKPKPTPMKRKRSKDPETDAHILRDCPPLKQPRGNDYHELQVPPPPTIYGHLESITYAELDEKEIPPSKERLSKRNLRLLNEEMDSASENSWSGNIKRTSSQRSLTRGSVAASERSEGTKISSMSTASYRHDALGQAHIRIHANPPLEGIQSAIDSIINSTPSESRQQELEPIIRLFHTRSMLLIQGRSNESNFVAKLGEALSAMAFSDLWVDEDSEWNRFLKPQPRPMQEMGSLNKNLELEARPISDSGQLQGQEMIDSDPTLPPAKRHQQSTSQSPSHTPSLTSQSHAPQVTGPQESGTMGPPSAHDKGGNIKTPRPDLSFGILFTALLSAVSSQGLDEIEAEEFINGGEL